MPDKGQHVLADSVLRGHHRRVLRGAAVRTGRPVYGDCRAPDGRPWHQLHGQRVQPARSPTGGAHAGHSGPVLLRVPAPVPRVHHVDHPSARAHVPGPGPQALLHHTVRVPGHGLSELGRQPDPVQPDVFKVPAWILQALPVPVWWRRRRLRRLRRRRPGWLRRRWVRRAPTQTTRAPSGRVPAPAHRHAHHDAVAFL